MYNPGNDFVMLELAGKRTFPSGGRITVLPGAAGALIGPTEFRITKDAKRIRPLRRTQARALGERRTIVKQSVLESCNSNIVVSHTVAETNAFVIVRRLEFGRL